MAQTWTPPSVTSGRRSAIATEVPNCLEALRTVFSGSVAPSSPVAYQLWLDTSTKTLYQRNAGNSAWLPQRRREVRFGDVALAARTWRALRPAVPVVIESVAILPSTTTSASVATTKEWTFLLKNQTTSQNLFSATPSTATTVSGVGGGELTADTGKVLLANQNATLAVGDLLYLVVGVNGSPTAVTDVSYVISYWELGT